MDLRETNPENRNRHPWELARAAALLSLVAQCPLATRFADVGAGDRFFTHMLATRSDVPVVAVDTAYAAPTQRDGCLLLPNVADVPQASVDCLFAMDMLEHVDDDGAFACMLARIMVPGGRAVFTVPAHPGLFSAHDEFLGHRRRYTRARLRALLEVAGFRIDELFQFFLAPLAARAAAMGLERIGLRRSAARGVGNWPVGEGHLLTRALTAMLRMDFSANRFAGRTVGISAGLSLCAVCTAGSRGSTA